MKEKINLFAEMIYNFLIGFWTIFTFLLMYGFGVDDNDGDGINMSIISVNIYLILLIPNNIIFLKSQKHKKIEKIFIIISFIVGLLLSIFFHKGQGIINLFGILFLILLNILFISLNKKTKLLYTILLLILDLTFIFYTLKYFNII